MPHVSELFDRLLGTPEGGVGGETYVPIECYCQRADGSRPEHGPHWVVARRLRRGGDLRGKAKVDREVQKMIDAKPVLHAVKDPRP